MFFKNLRNKIDSAFTLSHDNCNSLVDHACAIDDHTNQMRIVREQIEDLQEKLSALENENEIRKLKRSNEPWASVEMGDVNDKGQVKVEMDWNSAFIQLLVKAGYVGNSEEEIFQKYLLSISSEYFDRDITEDFKN